MRQTFVEEKHIKHVVEGLNKLYNHMIKTGTVDASEMKNFMEPYFIEAGYRNKQEKIETTGTKNKFRNKSKSADKNNIIILHDAGIGDFIIMSSVIKEIRKIYPKAHISLLVNHSSLVMAEHCPYIDEVVACKYDPLYKSDEFFPYYKKAVETITPLLMRRFDVVFNFGQYVSSQLLAYMCGAKERIDLNYLGDFDSDFKAGKIPSDFFSDFSTYHVDWRDFKNTHYTDMYLYVVQKYTNNKIHDKALELWLSPADKFFAIDTLYKEAANKKIYAISPGGSMYLGHKRWAPKNYAKLINMILAEEPSAMFAIFGGANDVEDVKILTSHVDPANFIDFTNKFSFRKSAAVLNLCDYYIGNDTGLMHAAAALNIPVLSPNCFPADIKMNGAASPKLYYPYGVPAVIVQPKHALPECKNSKAQTGCMQAYPHCINQITPETMFEALKILNKQITKNIKVPLFYN